MRRKRHAHGKAPACSAIWLAFLAATLVLPVATADGATKRYRVELIVFERLNVNTRSEYWRERPGRPAVSQAVELAPAGTASLDIPVALKRSEFRLHAVAERLARSPAYRPMLHIAWHQPGFSRSQAKAIHIHSDVSSRYRRPVDTPILEGTVQLHRGRYLHLVADLLYHRAAPISTGETSSAARVAGSRQPSLEPQLDREPSAVYGPTVVRLVHAERLRVGRLHYFDHPLFGILVRVDVVKPPDPPLEDNIDRPVPLRQPQANPPEKPLRSGGQG